MDAQHDVAHVANELVGGDIRNNPLQRRAVRFGGRRDELVLHRLVKQLRPPTRQKIMQIRAGP